jgi:KDO2-lipid IV(A) lauroyltransferase
LRQDWPVPWQPVWGDKRGPWRVVLSRAAQGLMGLAVRLPEPCMGAFSKGAGAALAFFLKKRSRVARDFLRQAYPELPEPELGRRVRRAWAHFLSVAVEAERFQRRVPAEEIRARFEVRWCPGAQRVSDARRGAVIVTAHVGNWEVAPALAPWLGFDPFYAVAKPIRNRPFSKVVQRGRERLGVRLLPRRGAMKDAERILAAGGSIGMLLDQRARKKPVLAPFFGRLARCDRSAGVLMRRLGAPVLLVACYRTERPLHYRAEFFDCLEPAELAGATPEAIAARINRTFEAMIRAAPDQYFWLHDRYKDTPVEPPAAEDPERLSSGGSAVVE